LNPSALSEIEVRPGLTIVRSETLGKFFVRETMDRLEDLPAPTIKEIESFLVSRKEGS
jgi:hypothetical protein